MRKLLAAFKSASAISAADVETVRERIIAATEERKRIEAMRRPPGETIDEFGRWLDGLVVSLDPDALVDRFCWGSGARGWPQINERSGPIYALGLLALGNRDALVTAMSKAIATRYEGLAHASAEEQARMLAETDAEILRLCKQEEATIRAAEAAGVPIARREDAPPAVVLSFDEDLAA